MPHQTRDTSGFAPASHQSQALCLGTLGAAALLAPATQWGFAPPRLLAAWAVAGGGAWLMSRARRHWRLHELEDDGGAGPLMAEHPALLEQGRPHPQVQRVLDVVNSSFADQFQLDPAKFEFEEDGEGERRLISWSLKAIKHGALSTEAARKKLRETFTNSLGGFWKVTFDTVSDTVCATQVDDLPKVSFPKVEDWRPVASVEEAKKRCRAMKIELGIGENGSVISTSTWDYPHMQVIGESGAGKSVTVKAILEQLRAAGWMLLIGDGKGADYLGFNVPNPADHGLPPPGTVAYGRGHFGRAMDYIGIITLAYQEMLVRQDLESARPAGQTIEFPPIFVLLDEIKSLRSRWRSELTKEENIEVDAMVEQITALGRAFRVHLAIVSQDAYRDSIPRQWVNNIRMRLVVGRPSTDTITKSFETDKALKARVEDISRTMNPKQKGRCIIATEDRTGHLDVAQYQNFYTYCPGADIDYEGHPPGTREEWTRFKAEVSDRVPRLYSRLWFKIDHPSEAQLELEAESGEELGFIDFNLFTVSEVKKLKRIALDMRNEDGEVVPNPAHAKYDPLSPSYVCREPVGRHAERYVKLEL